MARDFAICWGARGVWQSNLTPGSVSRGRCKVFEDRYNARIPLRRMSQAKAVTGALVFSASDAPSDTTGQNVIDGRPNAW